MVTNLQFAAVAAYLLWCLFAAVSDRFEGSEDPQQTPTAVDSITGTNSGPDRGPRRHRMTT